MNITTYLVKNQITGEDIDTFFSRQDAKESIKEYEEEDQQQGIEPDNLYLIIKK